MFNRKILAFALLSILTLAVSSRAQFSMGTECEPYGSILMRGEPASDGLAVIAYVGDIELARTQCSGGQYSLVIPTDDPDTPQRDGYQPGDIITILVGGNPTNPAFEAFAGRQRRDVEVITLDIRFETWGRIKALFK